MSTLATESPITHLEWDIGWRWTITGALLQCATYLVAVDLSFFESTKQSAVAGLVHALMSLMIVALGGLIGLPIWGVTRRVKGIKKISFKPFLLLGTSIFIILGAAGKRYTETFSAKTDASNSIQEQPTSPPEKTAEEKAIYWAKNARTLSSYTNNDFEIKFNLDKIKGDLKVTGWSAKQVGEYLYLTSYGYVLNGQTFSWVFEVDNWHGRVRNVLNDPTLKQKYGFDK